jgi:hypothetical protein
MPRNNKTDNGQAGRLRGPYSIAKRSNDELVLSDPETRAFAEALEKIQDPAKRACLAWLVQELSEKP